jgi:hypothetical protein
VSLPAPRPGLVIRYSYLWAREADAGQEEGVKDRPCAIVLVVFEEGDRQRVRVLPVTHSPPADARDGLEIPLPTMTRLGLDSTRSWIMLTEANDFFWPGPDLRFLPGHGPETAAYGMLPPKLFKALQERLHARYHGGMISIVPRSE